MERPAISIIIPIFNTERFLPACLESVCGQTLQALDIILLDDGSTDTSGRICDQFARRDPRIRVFHTENRGHYQARNIAIQEARKAGTPEDRLPAFVPGCVANGISRDVAEEIYNRLMEFASYGFNKAHAVCYAYLAYETAYLKTYYPPEFMSALMSSEIGNAGKLSGYMIAARQMGIRILPPDVKPADTHCA